MTTDPVPVQLLGAVAVAAGGRRRARSGLRRKSLLAVLALHAGEAVSTDRLIDIGWGEAPPATALNTLRRHVSCLRGVLGVLGGRRAIVSRPPGYCLALPAGVTGVAQAEALIAESRAAGDIAAVQGSRQLAVTILEQLRHRDADRVRARTGAPPAAALGAGLVAASACPLA